MLRRLAPGACLALLLMAAAVPAQAPDAPVPTRSHLTEPEPITPIPEPPAADPLKLALGEQLFGDPRVSPGGAQSCMSCHDTRTNGADARKRDPNAQGALFNTPTVFNAALSFRLTWEGTYRTFRQQAEAQLGGDAGIKRVVEALKADPAMVGRFRRAYGRGPDRANLLDAITTYELSLLTPGSRFDRWLKGDATALSSEEQHGYQLFKALGCISCHQGVNIGGNLFERHGIFHPLAAPNPKILRVPSLRNVATTSPYFHDGSAPTLRDAVRKMGHAQLDVDLSSDQITAIVAFLRTLTGTYQGHPVTRAP